MEIVMLSWFPKLIVGDHFSPSTPNVWKYICYIIVYIVIQYFTQALGWNILYNWCLHKIRTVCHALAQLISIDWVDKKISAEGTFFHYDAWLCSGYLRELMMGKNNIQLHLHASLSSWKQHLTHSWSARYLLFSFIFYLCIYLYFFCFNDSCILNEFNLIVWS